jgi:hypothetical protein
MAKLSYFDQQHGDRDDATHHSAIASGLVGERCKIGGEAIEAYMAESPTDVCLACTVPVDYRPTCGGRPPKQLTKKETAAASSKPIDVNAAVSYNQDQTAAAYRARAERFASSMTQQILAQEAKRKQKHNEQE